MVTLCLKFTAKTGNDVSRFTRSRKVVIRQSKCGLKVLQNRHHIHRKLLSEKGIIQFSHVFTTCTSAFCFCFHLYGQLRIKTRQRLALQDAHASVCLFCSYCIYWGWHSTLCEISFHFVYFFSFFLCQNFAPQFSLLLSEINHYIALIEVKLFLTSVVVELSTACQSHYKHRDKQHFFPHIRSLFQRPNGKIIYDFRLCEIIKLRWRIFWTLLL